MPKVNQETGDWMFPQAFRSGGSQLIGHAIQARTNPSDPPLYFGIGIFDFETESYKVINVASVKNSNMLGLTLSPDESHGILSNSRRIIAVNLETSQVVPVLEAPLLQPLTTVTSDGYLYYCPMRDERNIWLSKIEDVPMKTTDN